MNPGISNNHPSIQYYNSDYPSPGGAFPENFDATTEYQGIAADLDRYIQLAAESGGPILELCCGTGRVVLPLARAGHRITGVDISAGMLSQLHEALQNEPSDVRDRVSVVEQDITRLSLPGPSFRMAVLAFNSLLCIPDFDAQQAALHAAFRHLEPNGMLVIDIVNPLCLKFEGESVPTPFFTRRNTRTGNRYTRFAMMGQVEADQKQRLHGWYDEMDAEGVVRRTEYSLYWRPIFRYEMELMLRLAGLVIVGIEGGHHREPFEARSPRMLIRAIRPA